MSEFLFTSESVSEGHPDKVADQISDAILDAILREDKYARVAAETLVNTGLVVLAGEITTSANVDYIKIARETIKRIGYDNSELGFDYHGCAVMACYDKQSQDIAQGVNEGEGLDLNQGAGDQGLMFGYACDETPTLMPFPIYYAHRLVQRQAELRKDGRLPWLAEYHHHASSDRMQRLVNEWEGTAVAQYQNLAGPLERLLNRATTFLEVIRLGLGLQTDQTDCESLTVLQEGITKIMQDC